MEFQSRVMVLPIKYIKGKLEYLIEAPFMIFSNLATHVARNQNMIS